MPPGAPIGNRNALKHGLYSKKLPLPSDRNTSLSEISLLPEISLIRHLLDQGIEKLDSNSDVYLDQIYLLSSICSKLGSLLKTHCVITGADTDVSDRISEAIRASIETSPDD